MNSKISNRLRIVISILAFMLICSAGPRLRPDSWAKPVLSKHLENWHKIDDKLYRSAQPSAKAMKEIAAFGIKDVLNVRSYHTDEDEAKGTGLRLYRVKMKAEGISDRAVINALQIIRQSRGPVLVHCWHGSDRTGLICAMYRIIECGWTKEAAIDEMMNGGFGFHGSIYKNIPAYIRKVDIKKIREKIK